MPIMNGGQRTPLRQYDMSQLPKVPDVMGSTKLPGLAEAARRAPQFDEAAMQATHARNTKNAQAAKAAGLPNPRAVGLQGQSPMPGGMSAGGAFGMKPPAPSRQIKAPMMTGQAQPFAGARPQPGLKRGGNR